MDKLCNGAENDDIQPEDIRKALDKILNSDTLGGDRLPALLKYVVEEKLEGRGEFIKAYSIAQDVLGRSVDFDPQADSIVRVQMGRLRAVLDRYYQGAGNADAVKIVIPVGKYVPQFENQILSAPEPSDAEPSDATLSDKLLAVAEQVEQRFPEPVALLRRYSWQAAIAGIGVVILSAAYLVSGMTGTPEQNTGVTQSPAINTIAVVPMTSSVNDERHKQIAHSLTLDFVRTLQNGNFLSVVQASAGVDGGEQGVRRLAQKMAVRFLLTGYLHHSEYSEKGDRDQLTLSLIDGKNGVVLWSEKYDYPIDATSFEYKLFLRNVSFDLNPAYYAAAKNLLNADGTEGASAVELFLISNWVPGTAVSSLAWELERVDLAQQALKVNPNYGPAHAVLADKLAYLATVDPPSDTEEKLAQSRLHAAKALAFANQQADSLYNIVSHKLHLGEIQEAARLAVRTAELDPKNVLASFYTRSMVFTCKAASDEQLSEFVKFHNGLNRRNPARWITSHTIARIELNRKNYAMTVKWGRESEKIFQSLGAAFQLSAALVQMGDVGAARRILNKQKKNWPNLDISHFANVVIPRRCGRDEAGEHLRKVYQQLADAMQN